MFVSRPFLKIGFSCASALLLVTANASAHDSDKRDTQSYRIAQVEFDLALDVRYLKSHGVENFGDFSNFDRNDFGRDNSFGWEDSNHSGKSSKNDRDSRFSFDRHDGWHFEFVDSRHDKHGRGNDWGNGSFGGGFPQSGNGDCNGGGDSNGGDPICGGNPTGGDGDPNGGGNPGGNSATPEPRASMLSAIAAGVMALLLVGRNVRRRAGVNRG